MQNLLCLIIEDEVNCQENLEKALSLIGFQTMIIDPTCYKRSSLIIDIITLHPHDQILIFLDGVFFMSYCGDDIGINLPEEYQLRIIACGQTRFGYGAIGNKRETLPELVAKIKELLAQEDIREHYAL